MAVYVECSDHGVLAEHQGEGVRTGRVEVRGEADPDWRPVGTGIADGFARRLGRGFTFRLVFLSPEAAGAGLVDYRDRLGAVVQWREEGSAWRTSDASDSRAADVAADLRNGREYRIVAAPTAPEEPRAERSCVAATPGLDLRRPERRSVRLTDEWTTPDGGKATVIGWHPGTPNSHAQIDLTVTVPASVLFDPDSGWDPSAPADELRASDGEPKTAGEPQEAPSDEPWEVQVAERVRRIDTSSLSPDDRRAISGAVDLLSDWAAERARWLDEAGFGEAAPARPALPSEALSPDDALYLMGAVGTWAATPKNRALYDVLGRIADGPPPRPALPDGVEPVDPAAYGAVLLVARDLPDGWQWAELVSRDPLWMLKPQFDPDALVLARPVPEPEGPECTCERRWLGGGAVPETHATDCALRAPEPEGPATERVDWFDVPEDYTLVGTKEPPAGIMWRASGPEYVNRHGGTIAKVHDPAIGWDESGTVEVLPLAEDGGRES